MRKLIYPTLAAFLLMITIGNIGFYAGRSFVCYASPTEVSYGQP